MDNFNKRINCLNDKIDYIFARSLPKIFAMNRRLVLRKI